MYSIINISLYGLYLSLPDLINQFFNSRGCLESTWGVASTLGGLGPYQLQPECHGHRLQEHVNSWCLRSLLGASTEQLVIRDYISTVRIETDMTIKNKAIPFFFKDKNPPNHWLCRTFLLLVAGYHGIKDWWVGKILVERFHWGPGTTIELVGCHGLPCSQHAWCGRREKIGGHDWGAIWRSRHRCLCFGGGNSKIFGSFIPKIGEASHFDYISFFNFCWNQQLVTRGTQSENFFRCFLLLSRSGFG